MSEHPLDDAMESLIRASFARQGVMTNFGVVMSRVERGAVELTLPYRADLTQQHGFIHAGVVATVLDSACGYAAFTVMPADVAVLTVEYKINLLRPAEGERIVARARVKRAGRTLVVCTGDAFGVTGDTEKAVATMLATVMAVPPQDGMKH
ncbi:MAG: PaaI family thioesterase [Gemmataceae bacterium]|nr:PaaI family thioesterase [Gemmataceae bacterium]